MGTYPDHEGLQLSPPRNCIEWTDTSPQSLHNSASPLYGRWRAPEVVSGPYFVEKALPARPTEEPTKRSKLRDCCRRKRFWALGIFILWVIAVAIGIAIGLTVVRKNAASNSSSRPDIQPSANPTDNSGTTNAWIPVATPVPLPDNSSLTGCPDTNGTVVSLGRNVMAVVDCSVTYQDGEPSTTHLDSTISQIGSNLTVSTFAGCIVACVQDPSCWACTYYSGQTDCLLFGDVGEGKDDPSIRPVPASVRILSSQ